MPILTLDQSDFGAGTFDTDKVVAIKDILKLRRVKEGTDEYSMTGIHSVQEDIELLPIKMYDLFDLFGFQIDRLDSARAVDAGDTGDINFQVSFDGGTIYYYWNGAAWTIAGANDFSSSDDVEEFINIFPFPTTPIFRLKIRITSSTDRNHAPALRLIHLYYEVSHNTEEDILRTFSTYIDENVEIKKTVMMSSFPFQNSIGTDLPLNQIYFPIAFDIFQVSIYNLANDPIRANDLFLSMNRNIESDVYLFTLTSSQSIGDQVEVQIKMKTKIYVGADSDFINASVPATAIQIVDSFPAKDVRIYGKEVMINRKRELARIREEDFWEVYSLSLLVSTRGELNSQLALSGFKKLLRDVGDRSVKSIGHGLSFIIMDVEPYIDVDNESDAVFRKGFNIIFLGRVFSSNYEEVKLTKEINIGVEVFTPPDSIPSQPDPNSQFINITE